MIPTSAFRETLILILFGIILVPIAAKRAQDAPGYWQTFSKELSSLAYKTTTTTTAGNELPLWSALLNDTVAYRAQPSADQIVWSSQQQRAKKDPKPNSVHAASNAQTRTPLTIRFRVATSEQEAGVEATATTGGSGEAQARAQTHAAIATPAPQAVLSPSSAEPPVVNVKQSEASRGRWTLIWAGSAIAAVAAFFASC